MMSSLRPSEEQIQAYIDGLLSGRDLAAIASYLRAHPEIAYEVETLRRQNEALKRIGEEVLAEPIPERLRAVVRCLGRSARDGSEPCSRADLLTARPPSSWFL
jgi:anti-sigma factor RsiW